MKLVLRCRTCNQQLIEWIKPTLTEQDALELISCTSCTNDQCDLFINLYDEDGTLLASIDEPNLELPPQAPTKRWWEFWK
jgi:hypothetical protein